MAPAISLVPVGRSRPPPQLFRPFSNLLPSSPPVFYSSSKLDCSNPPTLKSLLRKLSKKQVLIKRETDGSTALHIAAIVGNTDAAIRLVSKNNELLRTKNKSCELPLDKAYQNMHLYTIAYLLRAFSYNEESRSLLSSPDSVHTDEEIGVRLLVNAITRKNIVSRKYIAHREILFRSLDGDISLFMLVGLASEWVRKLPKFASKTDHVLLALAKTFPTEPDYQDTLIYPSMKGVQDAQGAVFSPLIKYFFYIPKSILDICNGEVAGGIFPSVIFVILRGVPLLVASAFLLICFLILIVCFLIRLFNFLAWHFAYMLDVGLICSIEDKITAWANAKKVLRSICNEIDKLGTHHHHYSQPILEAASRNAYIVVDEILLRSPEAIQSKDKSGYDIILLAIINRSEKIYSLINDIGEGKNHYRTYKDSNGNNILHLTENWHLQAYLIREKEVKKLVFPTHITKENIAGETPDMVFTREHKNLVKEGEEWIKTTAESCSITAALIITIVFAATITVPGGSNQEKGTPLFKKETAFIIFAVSNAISLFASSTSLLVFLSILTARFAEKDFLFSLPSRLFIGLFSLLLSTITMIAAYSATVFLVFCGSKPEMLFLICGLAFIPIASFVVLQSPLMVDLFRSTYLNIFAEEWTFSDYLTQMKFGCAW
ncbi:uncharacterized protein LOC143553422 [Bidens hawaiensis]|uniref:uncharacterized protein LOC143553422 n=1 Tax=Bidens hawaiensis TaxID=980011 RepID=UPI00404950D2